MAEPPGSNPRTDLPWTSTSSRRGPEHRVRSSGPGAAPGRSAGSTARHPRAAGSIARGPGAPLSRSRSPPWRGRSPPKKYAILPGGKDGLRGRRAVPPLRSDTLPANRSFCSRPRRTWQRTGAVRRHPSPGAPRRGTPPRHPRPAPRTRVPCAASPARRL